MRSVRSANRWRRLSQAIAVASLAQLLGATVQSWAADAFYLNLVEEGRNALREKRYAQAEADLRLATFGLLEEPAQLAEALVLLGTAQAGAGTETGFRETFARLVEVEQRFPSYATLNLEPTVRKAFEDEARRRITPAILESTAAFANLRAKEPEAAPSRRSRGSRASRAPLPVDAPPEAPSAVPTPATARPVGDSPPPPASPPAATPEPEAPVPTPAETAAPPAIPAPAPVELVPAATLERARLAMEAARHLAELNGVLGEIFPLADQNPADAPVQKLALELAYRASRWRDCTRFADRIQPDPVREASLCFYASVGYAEVGRRREAADLLRRCLPSLERSPIVERYLYLLNP